jgi:GTP-binding protein
LIGFPNVGKSTLLSIVSAARPKISNYHFTTLSPNLGVARACGGSFVVADIPGLIEGAHAGVGLGHEFLRHVERTRLLVHVVDVSGIEGRDPLDDFHIINAELLKYSENLAQKPQIVAANKADLPDFNKNYKTFKNAVEASGFKVFPISGATNCGINELMNYAYQRLIEIQTPITIVETDFLDTARDANNEQIDIYIEGEVFIIDGAKAQRLINSTNFGDHESMQHFQHMLKRLGIAARLKSLGAREGDLVRMCGVEFEYFD